MNETNFEDVLRYLLKEKIEKIDNFLDSPDVHRTINTILSDNKIKYKDMLALLDTDNRSI